MKILGIMGSPRIASNTDLLLDEALKGAQSEGAAVEKLVLDKMNISPCREFYACFEDGNCVIQDDMTGVYTKLLEADGIIVATPMFFYGVSAQLKALIDRCQAIWARQYVLKEKFKPGRKGAFIAVGATRGKLLFDGSVLTIKYFFQALDVEYTEELLIRGVDRKQEIKEHTTALTDAFALGKRLARKLAST